MTRHLAAAVLAIGVLGAWAQDANALMLALKSYYSIPHNYSYVNPDGLGVYNDGVNGPEFYVYYGSETWISKLTVDGPSGSEMLYHNTISVLGPNKSNIDFDFVPAGQTLNVNGTEYGAGTMVMLNSGNVNYDSLYIRERVGGTYGSASKVVILPNLGPGQNIVARTGAAVGNWGGEMRIFDVDVDSIVTDVRITDISGTIDAANRPQPITSFDVPQSPVIAGIAPSEIEFSHKLNRTFVLGVEAGKMAVYIGKTFTEMIDLRQIAADGGLNLNAGTIDFTGLAIDDVTGDFWLLTTNGLVLQFGQPEFLVPEPSALALAGMGICALLVYRRRQRKTAA